MNKFSPTLSGDWEEPWADMEEDPNGEYVRAKDVAEIIGKIVDKMVDDKDMLDDLIDLSMSLDEESYMRATGMVEEIKERREIKEAAENDRAICDILNSATRSGNINEAIDFLRDSGMVKTTTHYENGQPTRREFEGAFEPEPGSPRYGKLF